MTDLLPPLSVAHTTPESLAKSCARSLADRGWRFPAVFPYNRFAHAESTWWLSFKGSPAFSAAKLSVFRRDGALRAGVVLEKGYEVPEASRKASERMDADWDWHRYAPLAAAGQLDATLRALGKIGGQAVVHAHPGAPGGGARLVFDLAPWTLVDVQLPFGPQPLHGARGATSFADLVTRLEQAPGRQWWWYDLHLDVPLAIADADTDGALDETLVERVLLPLARWFWPSPQAA